jgi:hypothetical protein
MEATNTSSVSETNVYSPQQEGLVGSIPIYVYPGIPNIPTRDNIVKKETGEFKIEKPDIPQDLDILVLAKTFYLANKETLLKQYKGKYIAILNNKVIGSNKDFSKLAQMIYAQHGYQTIYMPFVDVKEKVAKIPSPRIKI